MAEQQETQERTEAGEYEAPSVEELFPLQGTAFTAAGAEFSVTTKTVISTGQ